MIALGTLAAYEELQAMIKGKIGDFLNAESKLMALQNTSSPSLKAKAAGLLAAHKMLESDLSVAQANVTKFQSGAWSFGDIITTGEIGGRLLTHVQQVDALEKEANQTIVVPRSGAVANAQSAMPFVLIGVGLLALYKLR